MVRLPPIQAGLLLREADIALQLTNQLSKRLCDRRQDGKINYPLLTLLRQRMYALACGYEDVNDHQALRHDALLQAAVGVTETLASSSTVSRMENAFTREDAALVRSQWSRLYRRHGQQSAPL